MRVELDNINGYYNSQSKGKSVNRENTPVVEKTLNRPKEIINEVDINDDNKNTEEHEVIRAIEHANKHFRCYDRRLEFSIHEETKKILVKVIDTEDDSIIREIPSEKILDMVAKLWELAGLFVDEKR